MRRTENRMSPNPVSGGWRSDETYQSSFDITEESYIKVKVTEGISAASGYVCVCREEMTPFSSANRELPLVLGAEMW